MKAARWPPGRRLRAQVRRALCQLDDEPRQEINADDSELTFSGLKREVVLEIRFFDARKRNCRLSDLSVRARKRVR
jgi:hypothetical protein